AWAAPTRRRFLSEEKAHARGTTRAVPGRPGRPRPGGRGGGLGRPVPPHPPPPRAGPPPPPRRPPPPGAPPRGGGAPRGGGVPAAGPPGRGGQVAGIRAGQVAFAGRLPGFVGRELLVALPAVAGACRPAGSAGGAAAGGAPLRRGRVAPGADRPLRRAVRGPA